jgi:hypothetical protein
MGLHYVNNSLVGDGVLDATRPRHSAVLTAFAHVIAVPRRCVCTQRALYGVAAVHIANVWKTIFPLRTTNVSVPRGISRPAVQVM